MTNLANSLNSGSLAFQDANNVFISGGYVKDTWLGLGLQTYSVTSSTDVTLTNPCPAVVSINMTTTGKKLILPPANSNNSVSAYGGRIVVNNTAAEELYAFDIYDANASLVFSGLVGKKSVTLYATSNATLGGSWSVSAELGTLSQQNAGNVLIAGGSINNTQIGTDPLGASRGVFSPLAWYWRTDQISANFTLDPDNNLSNIEYVNTAGVIVSAQTIVNYGEAYHVIIKNISSGNINFTPYAGDLVEGASTLVIPANTSVWISVNQTQWRVIANYNSETGSFGTMAYQNANFVDITGGGINGTTIGNVAQALGGFTYITTNLLTNDTAIPYVVDPVADKFNTVYTTSSTNVSLQAWANYDDGFTFSAQHVGTGTTTIFASGTDKINGAGTLTLNQYQGVVLQKSKVSGNFAVWAECRSNALGLIPVSAGGTEKSSLTAHGVMIGNGSSAVNVTAYGPIGYVLTGNGSAADPTFQDVSTLQTTITPYVVGADHANYTSINSAITQAVVDGASLSSPKVILLKPGTYTEDVTLYTGIILLGLDKVCWNGVYYQALAEQVLSTKIVGKITYNTSAVNANTYASIQNIWIAPPSDDVVTYTGQLSAGYTQLLYLDSCRLDITGANKYAFNLTNCNLNHNNCFINDNTSGTTGHYYTCAGDSNTVYIISTTSFIFADFGASPAVLPANAAPSVRMINSVTTASIDASSALFYNFRAQGTTHALVGATNLTPYHITGASTMGRIVYDNCNVTMNDVAVNIITIGLTAFIAEFNNTNFGDLFAPSSDLFSGGRQIFTNCGFQIDTNVYYVRNDLIKVGFSGSSKINKQAAVTTSNATPTLLDSVLVNQGESVIVTGTVIAQKSDSSDACGAYFSITARRESGGNITLVGSPVIDPNTTSSATVTVDVDTSSQSVRIIVTGIAATTYYWGTDYSYQKMLTSA